MKRVQLIGPNTLRKVRIEGTDTVFYIRPLSVGATMKLRREHGDDDQALEDAEWRYMLGGERPDNKPGWSGLASLDGDDVAYDPAQILDVAGALPLVVSGLVREAAVTTFWAE